MTPDQRAGAGDARLEAIRLSVDAAKIGASEYGIQHDLYDAGLNIPEAEFLLAEVARLRAALEQVAEHTWVKLPLGDGAFCGSCGVDRGAPTVPHDCVCVPLRALAGGAEGER